MIKSLIKSAVVGTVALSTIGVAAPAAQAHTVARTPATSITYNVQAFEDGSARVVRRVWWGRLLRAQAVIVVGDGALAFGRCTRITIGEHAPSWDGLSGAHRPGMFRAVSGVSCPGYRHTLLNVRAATDEDVEGDVW